MLSSVFVLAHNFQQSEEQIDNVKVDVKGRVDGVVKSLWVDQSLVPVIADIQRENNYVYPVEHASAVAEKHRQPFNYNSRQQCDKQSESHFCKSIGESGCYAHHNSTYQGCYNDGGKNMADAVCRQTYGKHGADGNNHKVIACKAHYGIFGGGHKYSCKAENKVTDYKYAIVHSHKKVAAKGYDKHIHNYAVQNKCAYGKIVGVCADRILQSAVKTLQLSFL